MPAPRKTSHTMIKKILPMARPNRGLFAVMDSLLFLAIAGTALAQVPSMPRIPTFTPPPSMPQMAPSIPRMDFPSMRIQSELSAMNRSQADSVARQSAQIRQSTDSMQNSMFAAQSFARAQENLRQAQAQASWASQQASQLANRRASDSALPRPGTFPFVARAPAIPVSVDFARIYARPALPLSHLMAFEQLPPGTEFYFPNDQARQFRWVKELNASARNLVNERVAAIPRMVTVIPVRPRN